MIAKAIRYVCGLWRSSVVLAAMKGEECEVGRFTREGMKIRAGQRRCCSDLIEKGFAQPVLRRNIHRLEKGLLLTKGKRVFGLEYVLDTVIELENASMGCSTVEDLCDEGKWMYSVLALYFKSTPHHAGTNDARILFSRRWGNNAEPIAQFCLYPRHQSPECVISYDALLSLARRRRSVRWFRQIPVPSDLIRKAVEVAAQSPSACNRQPYYFKFITDKNRIGIVAKFTIGTNGYADNIPVLAVVVGQMRNFQCHRDRHVMYIDGGLAVMSFMFALETLGLSSCAINWPDIEENEAKMEQELALEADERPLLLLAIGYEDGNGLVATSQKKSVSEISEFVEQ